MLTVSVSEEGKLRKERPTSTNTAPLVWGGARGRVSVQGDGWLEQVAGMVAFSFVLCSVVGCVVVIQVVI